MSPRLDVSEIRGLIPLRSKEHAQLIRMIDHVTLYQGDPFREASPGGA